MNTGMGYNYLLINTGRTGKNVTCCFITLILPDQIKAFYLFLFSIKIFQIPECNCSQTY